MTTLLAGVDRAAFVAALTGRLRSLGVVVSITSATAFVAALEVDPPVRLPTLYWSARVTLISRSDDIEIFDQVFAAVFEDAGLALDPHARRSSFATPDRPGDVLAAVAGVEAGRDDSGSTLPWQTLPRHTGRDDDPDELDDPVILPELLPSAVSRIADTPLDQLDEDELALLGRWLERSTTTWPTRRSRRQRVGTGAGRPALRATLAASRRTAWEPMEIRRSNPVHKPLAVTLLCDVSQSMQGHTTAYLHLMRVFARSRRAETFAFSTSLSRLTPALQHRSPAVAVQRAGEQVSDRFGGTHLAQSLAALLASRHGNGVRGGVLVVASDGWDSDDPARLAAVMERAARRARRVVWLNPRAAAPGFEPLVGSMAAALPYCDAFLPADTLRALPAVLDAIAGISSRA